MLILNLNIVTYYFNKLLCFIKMSKKRFYEILLSCQVAMSPAVSHKK